MILLAFEEKDFVTVLERLGYCGPNVKPIAYYRFPDTFPFSQFKTITEVEVWWRTYWEDK